MRLRHASAYVLSPNNWYQFATGICEMMTVDFQQSLASIYDFLPGVEKKINIGPFSGDIYFYKLVLQSDNQEKYYYKNFVTKRINFKELSGIKIYRDDFLVRPYTFPPCQSFIITALTIHYLSPCRSRKRHLWQDTRHGRRILRDMSIKEKRFYASMDRKSWNSNLVIPLKHIIFTIPFIADGSVLMCFLD